MKTILAIFAFAIPASLTLTAAAVPPPVPLSVTIVSLWRDGGPEQIHADKLIDALAEENWIRPMAAPYSLTPEQRTSCVIRGKDAAACLRSLNRMHVPNEPAAAPHIIMYITGYSHAADVVCIGSGRHASDPAAQAQRIDIKAALFAGPEERRRQRLAAVSCLMAARAEAR